jgi:hypothetical protein
VKAWAALALALANLLNRLLDWLEAQGRAAQQQQRQADHDQINTDPGAWADDHFGGVRPSKLPADAIAAAKAKDPGRV